MHLSGLGAGVEGEAGAHKLFTFCCLYFVYVVVTLILFSFRCLPYAFADVVVGGFGAPDGLGAGVEGDKAGALKLFTLCCLYFAYVVVGGFGALIFFLLCVFLIQIYQ